MRSRPLLLMMVSTVDTDEVASPAVDDGVQRDGSLAGLAVANDQFALPAADGDHGVNSLEAGGHGLAHRLAVHDAGREALDGIVNIGDDRALFVNGLAKCVDHAPDHGFADRDAHDAAGALDLVAFLDLGVLAEQHYAYLVLFQVHGDAENAVGKREQLASHDLVEAVGTRDAVAQGDDGAYFVH